LKRKLTPIFEVSETFVVQLFVLFTEDFEKINVLKAKRGKLLRPNPCRVFRSSFTSVVTVIPLRKSNCDVYMPQKMSTYTSGA